MLYFTVLSTEGEGKEDCYGDEMTVILNYCGRSVGWSVGRSVGCIKMKECKNTSYCTALYVRYDEVVIITS